MEYQDLQAKIEEQERAINQLFGLARHHGWDVDAYLALSVEPVTEAEQLESEDPQE